MRIRVVTVGKLKDPGMREVAREYLRRLAPYVPITVDEVADEPEPRNPTGSDVARVQSLESQRLAALIGRPAAGSTTAGSAGSRVVVALDRSGRQSSSEEFASWLSGLQTAGGQQDLFFAIGGACGLSREFLSGADHVISLSKMTFPHQLARVILLEQIYRAFKIIRGEPYHK